MALLGVYIDKGNSSSDLIKEHIGINSSESIQKTDIDARAAIPHKLTNRVTLDSPAKSTVSNAKNVRKQNPLTHNYPDFKVKRSLVLKNSSETETKTKPAYQNLGHITANNNNNNNSNNNNNNINLSQAVTSNQNSLPQFSPARSPMQRVSSRVRGQGQETEEKNVSFSTSAVSTKAVQDNAKDEKEYEMIKTTVQGLSKELKEKEKAMETLLSTLETVTGKLKTFESKIQEINVEIDRLKAENQFLKHENTRLLQPYRGINYDTRE